MNTAESNRMIVWIILGLLALNLVAYVLFQDPRPGVADQGDFDRVMNVSGLELTSDYSNNPDFVRFLDYPVFEFKISHNSILQTLNRLKATSISYLITPIGLISMVIGQPTFKTTYLAGVYSMLYLFALFIILGNLGINSIFKIIIVTLAAMFVLLDGNYLVWFNSLYGEPMMITSLLLYIAAWTYYISHHGQGEPSKLVFIQICSIFAAAFLFLGSKMQVISAVPVICLLSIKLIMDNRKHLSHIQNWSLVVFLIISVLYPINLNLSNAGINNLTKYNSVFFGILKHSPNPRQDLVDLGLNPDLAVDAGKHAFLPEDMYNSYPPGGSLTQQEFFSNITNADLIKYYLSHPVRLIQGIKYSASQAFSTSTFLGKYSREYSETPIRDFDRITFWSAIRGLLPKKLWFIVSILLCTLAISIREYRTNIGDAKIRERLILLWGIMIIGFLQFPMPYVGNGYADTAKQLFLFNFIFDILLLFISCWLVNQSENIFYIVRSKFVLVKKDAELNLAKMAE